MRAKIRTPDWATGWPNVHYVPVLFGQGRRLFEHLGIELRELERIRVLEGEAGVTHLRYRVAR